jgi:hypothetical protein
VAAGLKARASSTWHATVSQFYYGIWSDRQYGPGLPLLSCNRDHQVRPVGLECLQAYLTRFGVIVYLFLIFHFSLFALTLSSALPQLLQYNIIKDVLNLMMVVVHGMIVGA